MQITKKQLNPTTVQLNLVADDSQLADAKKQALAVLGREVKVQGFRQGKAPASVLQKHIRPEQLQTEFLERAVNAMYTQTISDERIRPVAKPKINVKKFVPFSTLEVEATVECIGQVKLADYKKIKLPKTTVKVEAKEVSEVLDQLAQRDAKKKEVSRASKKGDQVWLDFKGQDAKTKEAIKGADGKDYPLALGSNTFIPGFEDNLIGLKAGDSKQFDLTFPKDYGVKALQNRKVSFNVSVIKVQEVVLPKIDDAFAAKVGPFKTVAELKADVKKELTARKEADADQTYGDELIKKITEKSTVHLPSKLVDEQVEALEREQRQNLTYRGQTWQEFLETQGQSEEEFRKSLRPAAELRVKAGIVLAEVAEAEQLTITPDEFNAQMDALKARYTDAKMQEELKNPKNRRDILSRMLTQKTIAKLKEFAG